MSSKQRMIIIGLALLLCLVPILIIGGFNAFESYRLSQARRGLEAIKADLVTPAEFELITTVSTDFSGVNLGTCYYGRDYLILGSFLPDIQALDKYENYLDSSGWLPRDRQYADTRTFYYGENALLVATTLGPGDDTRNATDYEQLRKEFETIIFVRVEFQLPSRVRC